MIAAAVRMKKKSEKHKYLVVEVSQIEERRYPNTLFGCETIEEALKICKQMNADAGFQKFAVRGNAAAPKEEPEPQSKVNTSIHPPK